MKKPLVIKLLILCVLIIIGAVFQILEVPQLLSEFVNFAAVIIALVMIKQLFDYLHEKRE